MSDTERMERLAELLMVHGTITLRRGRWEEGDSVDVTGRAGCYVAGTDPQTTTLSALREALDMRPEEADGIG